MLHHGLFPCDQKFPFAVSEISGGEWKSIFRNSYEKEQPCKLYRKFGKGKESDPTDGSVNTSA